MKYLKYHGPPGLFLIATIVLMSLGCSDEVVLRRITGVVTLDGKPLDNGQVVITPVDQKSSAAAAEIVNGQFSCPVMPGEKKVSIQSFSGGINEMGFPIGKELLPEKYNDETTLTISVENKNGQSFAFDLDSK